MKIVLSVLILIALTSFSHAQWFPLNSGTTNNLNALSVVDSLNVYAVGDSGIILKTIDGGETWNQQNPIFTKLTGVSFCDQNTGMAVGDNGVILKTTNGGNVWFPLNSGITATHKFVWFHSPSNATIIQGGNKYIVTSDGGINWQTFSPYGYPWDFGFWDMGFTNWEPRRGVFAGNGYLIDPPNGPFIRVMFISVDGTNWNSYLQQNTMYSFKQVSVLPNGRVFALELNSPDRIITSSTGTGSWQTRGIIGEFVNDLFFVNENSGTALKSNGIFRTSDGGWNWEKVSPLAFKSVAFADSNIGYAIGGGGAIAKTLNGGVMRNLFPSELYNKYQTEVFVEGSGSQSSTSYESYEIVQDSIINGKRFIRFGGHSPFDIIYFYHYDMAKQKLFIKIPSDDSIRLAADFNLPAGYNFMSYISGEPLLYTSEGVSNLYLFDDTIKAFKMEYNIAAKKLSYTFADNIGLSRFYSYETTGSNWSASTYDLLSAIIDTVIYNPIYLDIYSVSPLDNRPVNNFPFVLNGYYNTNLNLIDTFFVELVHLRGIDTIGRLSYPFNNNSANITLSPLEGDRLLIKAHIGDHSIFNNSDTYPDTGYAEILVLPSTTDADENHISFSFQLNQNYPNPFNPATSIQFQVPSSAMVRLIVYDVMGNEIATLVNEEKQPGIYTTEFNGAELSSGVYFYRLSAGGRSDIKKMIMMK